MDEVQILPMREEDYDAVRALWMTIRGFGIRALDDSREDVARFIRRNPTTSVVAVANNDVGNAFWRQIGWKKCDVNYYEFVLNEKNITRFIGEDNEDQ